MNLLQLILWFTLSPSRNFVTEFIKQMMVFPFYAIAWLAIGLFVILSILALRLNLIKADDIC